MAGGEAEATIITKVVKDLLGDAAESVERDAARGAAEAGARDAAEAGARDAAEVGTRDAARDTAESGARDAAKPLEEGEAGRAAEARSLTKDPIDVATGEVVFAQTDAALPGVLPLIIERIHLSSYRQGGLYGISWASTLDQCLELRPDGIRYAAPDGTIRSYPPTFSPGVALPPTSGPVRPLTWLGDDGYVIDDPQSGRRLHFPAAGGAHGARLPISAVSDRNGNRITFEYDDETATLTEVRHSGGYRIAVDTDGPVGRNRVIALRLLTAERGAASTDSAGIVMVRYRYDGRGHLAEVVNSSGLPLRFQYNDAGRMIGWHDRNGHSYQYEYDDAGRAVRGYGTDGYLNSSIGYDPAGRWTVLTDSLGHQTTYYLNERRQVVAQTDTFGQTTYSEWDERDRLLARTDPLGRTTRYAHDAQGNCTLVQRPDATRAQIGYDQMSKPVQFVGPDGAVWRTTYDQAGNPTSVTDSAGATTRYGYAGHGALTSVTDALGNTSRIETDRAGMITRVVNSLNQSVVYERDAFGRIISVTDPLGATTQLGWNIEGRLTTRIRPSGAIETWTYDPEGNLIAHTNANGQTILLDYGPFDVLVSQTEPDGARLEFEHDTELRLTRVTNPQGLTWEYAYDDAGRLIQETDFNDRTLRYFHDPAGQLVRRVNAAGETTDYVRDALGNVVEQRSGDRVVRFGYDPVGRLTRATSVDADLAIHRDPLGRVMAETCNGRTLTSRYDALGRRIYRRSPSGAEAIWSYDAAGRPVELATAGQRLHFTYDAAGRETRRYIGAGAILDQQYDSDDRLVSQALWGAPRPAVPGTGAGAGPGSAANPAEPRLLQHRTYTRRPDGNITAIGDRLNGDRTLDLDRAGRVTAVHAHGWSERYAYDVAGNLTGTEIDGGLPPDDPLAITAGERDYAGTLIRRAGRASYDHDAQGRVIRRRYRTLSGQIREWTYTWDAEDRLTAVTTPDGGRWRYHYDPLGRRIGKQRLGLDHSVLERTDFTWDGSILVEQTYSGNRAPGRQSTTTWDYRPGTFRPLTQTERVGHADAAQQRIDQAFYAIIDDLIGTPMEMVDAKGDLARRSDATLWGYEKSARGDGAYCPLRFPGQYYDAETQLHYNFYRYYDSTIGRYGSSDPIGLGGGPNPHAYLYPHIWTDPIGLKGAGEVAVDTNPVTDALSGARTADVDAALAGRSPVLSPTAHRELLEGGHSPEEISRWLSERGGRMGPEATSEGVADIQQRLRDMWKGKGFQPMMADDDAAVLHSAAQEGLPIITNDQRFYRNAERLGYRTERY